MMKWFVLCLCCLVSTFCIGQKTEDYKQQEKVFRTGLKYNDLSVAKQALYNMMAIDESATNLLDSLAVLYYKSNDPINCLLVCNDVISRSPSNMMILEIKAITEQNVGLLKEALSDYEKLQSKSKEEHHSYQIAAIQYQLKRFGECESTINSLLLSPKIDEKKVNISLNERSQQEVPMKAALFNMKGVLYLDLARKPEAKLMFQEALKIMPDFQLPKGNLAALEQQENLTSPETISSDNEPVEEEQANSKKRRK